MNKTVIYFKKYGRSVDVGKKNEDPNIQVAIEVEKSASKQEMKT